MHRDPEPPSPQRVLRNPAWGLVAFCALAFGTTWALYAVGTRVEGWAGGVLRLASGFGPTVAALALVLTTMGGAGLRRWLRGLCRWRLRWRWYVGPLLAPPLILAAGVLAHRAFGGRTGTSEHDPALWWMIPAILAVVLVVGGPIGEEFGWRGYALPRLQRLMGPVPASLLLGLVWGLWHLPRMIDPTAVQHQVPWWIFLGQVLVTSVFHTWLLNSTTSVVPVLALHASFNTSVGLLPVIPATVGSSAPAVISLGIATIAAAALVIHTRGKLGT
jgi:uncharacterized protein